MVEQAPCFALGVGDVVLITQVEDTAGRQHRMPMAHQLPIAQEMATEYAEVVGIFVADPELGGVAGEAGVDRIAHGVDDLRLWQHQMDEAEMAVIAG